MVENWLFAGTLGTVNDTAPFTLAPGGVKAETKQCLENIKAILVHVIDEPKVDVRKQILKVNVALTNEADFAEFNEGKMKKKLFHIEINQSNYRICQIF